MTTPGPGTGRPQGSRAGTGRALTLGAGAIVLAAVVFVAVAAFPRSSGSGSPAASASSGGAASPAARGAAATPTACGTPAPVLGAASGLCTAPSAGATVSAAGSLPAAASPSGSSGSSPSPASGPAASPSGAPEVAAPTSARGFKVRATVVPLAFPLPSTATHSYGDAWRAPRDGVARSYNQIRGIAADGSYLRAHDGFDILVKNGTPVLAPFSGTIVDAATRWKPWDPGRYGNVVVIESDEPTSPGYVAILAHLSKTSVAIGDHVERGQVVGRTGQTGNAVGTKPHLHMELRAPFLIRYGYAGVIRRLDVFDAEPSIRAADPRSVR